MTQEKPSGANQPDDGAKEFISDDTAEDIPTLNETVQPDDAIHTLSLREVVIDEEQSRNIATLEAIVFDGEDSNAPPADSGREPAAIEPKPASIEENAAELAATVRLTPIPAAPAKPLPRKSENPFLPQHILDRLNQGRRDLVEEIAQSGAALDASTAMLRTRAQAERINRPSFSEPSSSTTSNHFSRDKSAYKKQQLIDELVDEYLPLLASELRRRLKKILDE